MFTRPNRFVNKVYLHCSASDHPHHDDVSVIDKWHKARGWNGIGYHYFIKKNGTLQQGRALNRVPAAQAGHNRGSIAICLHGLSKCQFTAEQFATLQHLCMQINSAYAGGITFHGHTEVSAKSCPVFDYKKVLRLNKKGDLGL